MEEKLKAAKEMTIIRCCGLVSPNIDNYTRAADIYIAAGNSYRMENKLTLAYRMFKKAAKCYQKVRDMHESSIYYLHEAAKCIKKIDNFMYVDLMHKIVNLEKQHGRVIQVANAYANIADVHEKQNIPKLALKYNQLAYEYYDLYGSEKTCWNFLGKIISLHIELKEYNSSITKFELLIEETKGEAVYRFKNADLILRICLCHLLENDYVETEKRLKKYTEILPEFNNTLECKLLQNIIECCENHDNILLIEKVEEYEDRKKLDKQAKTLIDRLCAMIGHGLA